MANYGCGVDWILPNGGILFCIADEELSEKKAANDISFSWLLLKSNEESCFIHKSIPFRLFVFEQGMVSVLFNGSGFVFVAGKIFVYDSGSYGLRVFVPSV